MYKCEKGPTEAESLLFNVWCWCVCVCLEGAKSVKVCVCKGSGGSPLRHSKLGALPQSRKCSESSFTFLLNVCVCVSLSQLAHHQHYNTIHVFLSQKLLEPPLHPLHRCLSTNLFKGPPAAQTNKFSLGLSLGCFTLSFALYKIIRSVLSITET